MMRATMTIATAMPIPSPARAPAVMRRLSGCPDSGAAYVVLKSERVKASTGAFCFGRVDILVCARTLCRVFFVEREHYRTE